MKKINRYMIVLAVIFASCSEDIGNYEYRDLVPVTIEFGETNEFDAVSLKPFQIEPIIETELDESNFQYEWFFDGELVSTERNLDVVIKLPASIDRYIGRLTVTDQSTDLQYTNQFSVNVSSVVGRGWLILSEVDNQSMLGHKAESDNLFTQNIFEQINGRKLGANPISITFGASPADQIIIALVGSGQYGAGINGNTFEEVYTIAESMTGEVPQGIPNSLSRTFFFDYFLWNNKLHVGLSSSPDPRSYASTPMSDKEFGYFISAGFSGSVLYESTTGSWRTIGGFDTKLNENVVPDINPAPSFPLSNTGFELVNAGIYEQGPGGTNILHIMKDGGVLHEMKLSVGFGGVGTISKRVMPGADLVDDNTVFYMSDATYYYFSSGKKLYRRSHLTDDDPVEVMTFSKDIVYMRKVVANRMFGFPPPDYAGNPLLIATYDGSGGQTGDIYFLDDKIVSVEIKEQYENVAGKVGFMELKER